MKTPLLIVFSLSIVLGACRLPFVSGDESWVQIYFNSFEDVADTVGWYGHGSFTVDNRSAPGGGKKSLKVAGGCIVPHARYYIGKMKQDGYLTLQFFGKNLEVGGNVSLEVQGDLSSEKDVSISDTVWKSYQLPERLYVSRNSDVYINLNSGGIVYSAMLIDLIRIRFMEK